MPPAAPEVMLDEDMDLETTCRLLGCSPDDVIAEFQRRHDEKVAKMRTEMVLAAKAGGERRMLRDEGDGGGYVNMMVHPTSFHYWGQRLGYECWDDPAFCREYLRDNPEARIKQRGTSLAVHRGARRTRIEPRPAAPKLAAGTILDAAGRPLA